MPTLPDPIDMDDPAHLRLFYENWQALNNGATKADIEEAIALGMTMAEYADAYLKPILMGWR